MSRYIALDGILYNSLHLLQGPSIREESSPNCYWIDLPPKSDDN